MQERATGRIRTGLLEVRLTSTAGLPAQQAREVLDVSPSGAGLKVAIPLATDQELMVELAHPVLEAPVELQARAAWCRMAPGDPVPHAGIEFVGSDERQRLALRLIQAAEVSCRVIDDGRTVGFIMTPTEGAWALYDASTTKVATLRRSGAGFEVTFMGLLPGEGVQTFDAPSLPEAVAMAIGLDGAPLIVPPEGGSWAPVSLDAPPRAAPRRPVAAPAAPAPVADPAPEPTPVAGAGGQAAYHSVLAGGYHVGFVAVTSVEDAWSLYDDGWREVAVVAPSRGRYKVIPVGADPNDSLVHAVARTFLGAVRIGFGLHVDPEVDPPVGPEASEMSTVDLAASQSGDEDEPSGAAADSDADIGLGESSIEPEAEQRAAAEGRPGSGSQKRQHHKVHGSEGLVGYVAPTLGVEGVWSAYSVEREKVAMIAPDGSRYRVVFMGTDADESLEYMIARNLKGAIAISFELDEIPTIEPPLPPR